MRIWYVEQSGTSASRIAKCDQSAATTHASSTRSLMMLTLALDRGA